MSEFTALARADQVPLDRGLTVRVGEREVALFRIGEDFFALDGLCPHRGGPLGEGTVQDGRVFCPLHGWEFDVKTGACTDNPERPATCLPARVVDGQVQVRI